MKTSLRWLFQAVFSLLFVGSAFAHYDPRMGRWLSRDPEGEAGGFNLYAYCGNDPVNRHDPLGLQSWEPIEDTQSRNEGMRELMNGGLTKMFQQLEREMDEANKKVASGQMGLLEGFGTRVVGKFDQLALGTFLFPWAYNDAAKEYGTYNPGEIIFHQGIVNGVVVNGSNNVYRAFTQPSFGSVMDVFDSSVDASLVWKGGKTSFGRESVPLGGRRALVSKEGGLFTTPLLNSPFSRNALEYSRAIEAQTGLRIQATQRAALIDNLRMTSYSRLSAEAGRLHRMGFTQQVRAAQIAEWERQTGQVWPRYTQDVLRGRLKNKFQIVLVQIMTITDKAGDANQRTVSKQFHRQRMGVDQADVAWATQAGAASSLQPAPCSTLR